LQIISSGKNFTKGTLAKKKKPPSQIISSGKNFTKDTLAKKEETAFAAH
jgi:hypothetical protein